MSDSIKNLFGEGSLSFEELLSRAEAAGVRIGDLSAAEAEHKKALDGIRIAHALERSLEKAGAKNGELVKRAVNMESISVEDGKVIGLDEQISALQASDPYLFRERETSVTGGAHGTASSDPDGMSDADYYRFRMKNG